MRSKTKEEMRKEYDFRGKKGVRGKYYQAMRNGYTTVIHKSDGSIAIKQTLPIYLDEDVQAYFPDSQAVNKALRGLIELVPEKPKL